MEVEHLQERKPRLSLRLLAGLALLAALVLIARYFPLQQLVQALRERVDELGPLAWIAFVALYVVATLLLVPGLALTLTAGTLFGLTRGVLAVWLAASITAALAFHIGRHGARARVEAWARSRPRFGAIDRAIGEGGWKVVVLLRLSPLVPFSVSNYLYGVSRIRFWPYWVASALAMLPGVVVYTYIGFVAGAGLEGRERTPAEWTLLVLGLAATVAASVLLTRLARRKLEEREIAGGEEA
jgi:uncharacterized membrane protein YdjX (TVP38/TMEM64 family)